MNSGSNRAEAERLLALAANNLNLRNYKAAREHALSAQDLEPLLEGTDQIVAIADVIFASEKRVSNNHPHNWYSILQIDRPTDDLDLIKKQYRRFALLLHPDKNRFSFADQAFQLVADAWSNLSDPARKSVFDSAFRVFEKVNLVPVGNPRTEVRRSKRANEPVKEAAVAATPARARQPQTHQPRAVNFWTACPYCYVLHQYPKFYEGCCLTCDKCNRTFEAVEMKTLPPLVPGKDAYYCCWGVFPIGFESVGGDNGGGDGDGGKGTSGFPNWMPRVGSESVQVNHQSYNMDAGNMASQFCSGNVQAANGGSTIRTPTPAKRGRGRGRGRSKQNVAY